MIVCKEHLELAQPQAVVTNSGVANAATGERGVLDALATAAETARLLDLDAEEVLVLSTGVIGAPLPLERRRAACARPPLSSRAEGGADAAEAIMTTDTHAKEAVAHGAGFTVGGMAKGSGMIHPKLATMLAVRHDRLSARAGRGDRASCGPPSTRASTRSPSTASARRTTPSSCSRTARAAIERTPATDAEFAAACASVCGELAKQIVADGEGATVLAEIAVRGAASESQARAIAERDRDVAAREDGALRPRRQLGPHRSPAAGLGEVQRRLRGARPGPALDR